MLERFFNSTRIDERLVSMTDPKSIAAEQYRLLRSRIERLSSDKGYRTFMITSAVVGEGKSMTAANLALSMAQWGDKRVVLVDADLRRPTLHTLFGVKMKEGLIDVLEGKAALETALAALRETALFFLPAGKITSASPEWLGSGPMKKLIGTLSQRFDFVLLDAPPILPLADSSELGVLVDGALLALRAGRTSRQILALAMESVSLKNWVGVILNGVDFERSSTYGAVYTAYQETYYRGPRSVREAT
ncbi:MAG TPA: CpsD/CapB family tyrosine-protein kinase [Candidatus Manganitrophaceae bacterium]|nr:CpsD/CapB family tyrosine-protein kinase [Candidatus Manganitrophaceae bacterium]